MATAPTYLHGEPEPSDMPEYLPTSEYSQTALLAAILDTADEALRAEALEWARSAALEAFTDLARQVFAVIQAVTLSGREPTASAVHDEFLARGGDQDAWYRLEADMRAVPDRHRAGAHADAILEAYDRRRVYRLARAAFLDAQRASLSVDAQLERLARNVSDLQESRAPSSDLVSAPIWPTLDTRALYGLAGEITRLIEPHTEADPVALLIQTLAYFGNSIGRTAHVMLEARPHYGNLFATIVGDTAKARKGTSEGWVVKTFTTPDDELARWREYHWAKGLVSGEGFIHAVRDISPEDPTYSQLSPREQARTQDKRLLVRESEYGAMLRVMGRDGNSLSGVIRDAWDGEPLSSLGKRAGETATGAHISIIGHVTRDELLRYLSATEGSNGFGNRFLWLCVRRSKRLPEGGALPDEALDPYRAALINAVRTARMRGALRRDEGARALWHEVYDDLSAGAPGLFGAMTARAEAQVMRLALLYALLDEAGEIKRPHLEAALALWRYCEASARYLFGDKLADPHADTILQALRAAGDDGLTRTQISHLFGRNVKADDLARALGRLRDQRLAECGHERSGAAGGRSIERWRAIRSTKKHEPTDPSELLRNNSYFVCPECGGIEGKDYGGGERCIVCDAPMISRR